MKLILITILLFVATITSYTQTRALRACQTITEKSIVRYTNKACTVVFLKGELMNAFSYAKTTNWFLLKSPEEKQAALRAVALLKKEGPLTLLVNDPKAVADKNELASLIEQRLGVAAFLVGKIEVYDKNNKRQDTIETVINRAYYKFYLRNSSTPFFVTEDQ